MYQFQFLIFVKLFWRYILKKTQENQQKRNGIQTNIEETKIENIWYLGHTHSDFFENVDVPD